jgi:hypothetical protein
MKLFVDAIVLGLQPDASSYVAGIPESVKKRHCSAL